jgi:hypothetical protein
VPYGEETSRGPRRLHWSKKFFPPEKTASHYICRECVSATAKYKRDHPDEVKSDDGDN